MKKQIKRTLAVILVAAMALMNGCSVENNENPSLTPTDAVTQPDTENNGQTDNSVSVDNREENTPTPEPELDEVTQRMAKLTAFDVMNDMTIGWNLGNTLDSTNDSIFKTAKATKWETAWGNPVTTEELIQTVINEGFNVIRIPVSWNDHLLPGGKFEIEPGWMNRVQEVVDYAYNNGAYVLINAHHESWYYPYYDNQELACRILTAVWTQIAERFADYDERLIFQGLNEPRKVGTNVEWNGGDKEGRDVVNVLNQTFVDTVRATGGKNAYRMLIVSPYAANWSTAARSLVIPEDTVENHIIVSAHAYEPYGFALNTKGKGVWNNETSGINTLMKTLDDLFISKGIPVIIDEFGAMAKTDENNEAERAAWVEYYLSKAKEIGAPCVWWDNGVFEGSGECFGIIDRTTYEWKYPLLMEGIRKGLAEE